MRLRELATPELADGELVALRELLDAAFGTLDDHAFDDDDWAHALGGRHVVLEVNGEIVSHAAVVERMLEIGGGPIRTGYVEAVATRPDRQGLGHATVVMGAVNAHLREAYDLGALGTGSHGFYERLGWETWRGQAFVRRPDGERRTPEEEGYILVLRTPTTPPLDLSARISCDWRAGDVW